MDAKIRHARILQVAGMLLIIRGLTFAFVALLMDDVFVVLCCPYCPLPEVWEFYVEYVLPIHRNLSSIEQRLWPDMVLLFLLGAVLTVIAGMMGILYWKNPKRANGCLLLGIVAATVYPVLFWWGATHMTAHPYAFWFVRVEVGVGFLLAYVLYLVGACRLKKVQRLNKTHCCLVSCDTL